MPNHRKSPERRQRTQTRDAGDVGLAVVTDGDTPAPPHPSGRKLLKTTVDQWEGFWSSPLAKLITDADRPALERLFHLLDTRERLQRIYLKDPFTTGSTGQVVSHPAAKELASLDGRIAKLEGQFGLTPKARLDLGVSFGAAAKSLEQLGRDFDKDMDGGDDVDDDEDPRRAEVIDINEAT